MKNQKLSLKSFLEFWVVFIFLFVVGNPNLNKTCGIYQKKEKENLLVEKSLRFDQDWGNNI